MALPRGDQGGLGQSHMVAAGRGCLVGYSPEALTALCKGEKETLVVSSH